MTDEAISRKALLIIESPSLMRMHLMGKITFEQAFGIEEFVKFSCRTPLMPYIPKVRRHNQMIGDFNRLTHQLKSREGHIGGRVLSQFMASEAVSRWTQWDGMHGKRRGWMKELILFAGEKLDHVHVYFTETGEET